MWLARGRELPALVRVAVLRLLALALVLFTALRLLADLAEAAFTAYQETVKSGNADWIRVRVGPFGSREDAERAQQALKQAGVTAALIAL